VKNPTEPPTPFQTWYASSLLVDRFPVPTEIARKYVPLGVHHVINVSDEYIPSVAQACAAAGVVHHWFPLGEANADMGLSSLYGALVILHDAEAAGEGVLLHCHAGHNRSPTVAQAYYYMRTGQHWVNTAYSAAQLGLVQNLAPHVAELSERRQNAMLSNIDLGRLPARVKLEAFLHELNHKLNVDGHADRGGHLSHCQTYAEL
jgi:hypothetical protein